MHAPKPGFTLRDITYIAFCATLLSICAWIKIPFVIPFTLQSFGIFLAVDLLGGKRAFIAVLLYIALGALGLPVFSGFTGGIGILFGSTGGYILAFIAPPLLCWLQSTITKRKATPLCLALGQIICYCFGTFWYAAFYLSDFSTNKLISVLSVCVLPFILPDMLKLALAVLLSKRLQKHIK